MKLEAQLEVHATAEIIGVPPEDWFGNCHGISLAILQAGLVPEGRVARGWCVGVPGQHSWIAASGDCYGRDAPIIDPTLWTYGGAPPEAIWHGSIADGLHTPHGAGNVWEWGRPAPPTEDPIAIPQEGLSTDARVFLDLLGPLDRLGWITLASSCPVEGWPAGEIYATMQEVEELEHLVPIDRLGMLTDLNPGGLYLPGDLP